MSKLNGNISICLASNKLDYKNGDLNTSIVKTSLGRTIMIQWDETSPRPYSRHNLIQGTKGTLAGFPTRISLEGGVEGITKNHGKWFNYKNRFLKIGQNH